VLKSVVGEVLASGTMKGKVYVDCSTVHPDTSLEISEQISKAGGEFVAGECMFQYSANANIVLT
jgi:3-hydroxyisobutyrate dehydrogenase-like beta-hydroxyacid dehydrogenase